MQSKPDFVAVEIGFSFKQGESVCAAEMVNPFPGS